MQIKPENLSEAPETEADGIRAEAIRRAQVRQLARGRNLTPEQHQQHEQRRQESERKKAEAIANAERDAPIRARFHEWMERSGFRSMPIPEPGRSYSGAQMETLWEAYLDATLNERNSTTTQEEPTMPSRPQTAQELQDDAIANRRKPGRPPVRKVTASLPQGKPLSRRKFRITVNYGYDIHSVTVTAKIVDQIQRGEAVTVKGQGFYIEGEKSKDIWSFNCTGHNALEVDGEDGYQIFIGEVTSATITEVK